MGGRLYGGLISDYKEVGLKKAIRNKWYDIRYPFIRVYRYISKVIDYSIHLWGDYDFDDIYIFTILKKKLTRMADFFESDKAMTLSAKTRAKQMRRCIALIERIEKDEYADVALDQLERKYGKMEWEFLPTDREGFSELYIHRDASKGTPDYEAERKESTKIYKNAERQKQADIDYLFAYMAKHIQGWWD